MLPGSSRCSSNRFSNSYDCFYNAIIIDAQSPTTGSISVTVTDQAGTRWPDSHQYQRRYGLDTATTDAEGKYQAQGIAPGTYMVNIDLSEANSENGMNYIETCNRRII
ncbi:MAG: carboxypeptidase-like regulatory domain-containing protein [Desulfitobacteriaceae bacterium]